MLHLGDKKLKLPFEALPFALRLACASGANSGSQHFRRERNLTGTKDEEAVTQLLQGESRSNVIALIDRTAKRLQVDGKFTQEIAAELHQELRIAPRITQNVIAVERNIFDQSRFR